jgi:hypothetical protein
MATVKTRSFPRAGFLGNPSDGYFGKTVSFAFADYCVDLTLSESSMMRFVPGEVDDAAFDSPEKLVRDIRLYGYYGGIRMLKAVAKLFVEYCFDRGIELPRRNFTAEYRTNIPRLVGLSGSSAICSASFAMPSNATMPRSRSTNSTVTSCPYRSSPVSPSTWASTWRSSTSSKVGFVPTEIAEG